MLGQHNTRVEDGRELSLLWWRFAAPQLVASTASSGGGVGERCWVINAQVGTDYARTDQQAHAQQLAEGLGLSGPGVTMFTAVDVADVRYADDGGVRVAATVGLRLPTWAADADGAFSPSPGTINIFVAVPVRLSTAALLNALCTATEAKAQALFDARVPGTGTASDAMTVVCPVTGDEEPFGGPRSTWGARVARAVHAAVGAGI
jgi:adenosylcobinamide amidohydrolase